MPFILSILSIFILYIKRFSKDFDEEQVSIFLTAIIVILAVAALLIWLTNRA